MLLYSNGERKHHILTIAQCSGRFTIRPNIIELVLSPNEPVSICYSSLLIRVNPFNLPADRHVLDSLHYRCYIVVLVFSVNEIGIITHIHELSKFKPFVSTMKTFPVLHELERWNLTEPGLKMREVVRNRICPNGRHL